MNKVLKSKTFGISTSPPYKGITSTLPLSVRLLSLLGKKKILQAVNSHLLPVVKSVWVVRVVLGLTLHCSCSVTLREVKAGVDTVDIQN